MTVPLSRRSLLALGGAALAAPSLVARPGFAANHSEAARTALTYTRRIGELEVTAISDGHFELAESMFVNIDPEIANAALEAAFIDPTRPQHAGVILHLVRGGGRTMLIDTGTADLLGPNLGKLPAALAALGVAPEDVDTVLITHLHPDHMGGLLAGDAPAYPNATVHVSETELAYWTDAAIAAKAPDWMKGFFARASATAAAYGDRLARFNGDVELVPGATAVGLPGHTVGHTGFRLASGDAELLLFADAAHVAAVQFAHPEASFVYDTDPEQSAATRKGLLDMLATDRTLAAATHLPFPGIGHVARAGDAYAWVPEIWQYE